MFSVHVYSGVRHFSAASVCLYPVSCVRGRTFFLQACQVELKRLELEMEAVARQRSDAHTEMLSAEAHTQRECDALQAHVAALERLHRETCGEGKSVEDVQLQLQSLTQRRDEVEKYGRRSQYIVASGARAATLAV